jgi:hypothetical protein
MDWPIEQLLAMQEETLLFRKWTEVSLRAARKMADEDVMKEERVVKDQPLAMMKFMAKIGSRRPG